MRELSGDDVHEDSSDARARAESIVGHHLAAGLVSSRGHHRLAYIGVLLA